MKYLYMALPLMLLASLAHAHDKSAIQYEGESWDVKLADCKIIDTGSEVVMRCKELECADRMRKAMNEMDSTINTAIAGKDAADISRKLLASKRGHSQWDLTIKECVK